MSVIQLDKVNKIIYVDSVFNIYGTFANEHYAQIIQQEIEQKWNAADGKVLLFEQIFKVIFRVKIVIYDLIHPDTILQNEDYINNYIRIETASKMHVSFVDGILSNSGYFITSNLEQGSTVAHEFGHMLGLKHPDVLDIRGKGQPSIMYPRGTLVDPAFQYDAQAIAGQPGGTINPTVRIVTQTDIDNLKIAQQIEANQFFLGKLTNKHHEIFIAPENS